MKALFAATAMVLAVGVATSAARAEGPRPSSANNWAGMVNANGTTVGAYPIYEYPVGSTAAPRYEWREGYSHGGRWQGGWVLVQ